MILVNASLSKPDKDRDHAEIESINSKFKTKKTLQLQRFFNSPCA